MLHRCSAWCRRVLPCGDTSFWVSLSGAALLALLLLAGACLPALRGGAGRAPVPLPPRAAPVSFTSVRLPSAPPAERRADEAWAGHLRASVVLAQEGERGVYKVRVGDGDEVVIDARSGKLLRVCDGRH